MARILDTTRDCTPQIACLKSSGFDTVVRYYSKSAWKRIGQAEARALADNDISIVAVYQNRQNQAADFDKPQGERAGEHAYDYASNVIFQPAGSAIYFSVDFDASEAEVNQRVIPFFAGIRSAFQHMDGGGPARYRIGVYGSGRVCRLLSADDHVELMWLAQATGWAEFRRYLNAKKWHLKQELPAVVCGMDCDPDVDNPELPDFGAFTPDVELLGPSTPVTPAAAVDSYTVNARDGLRMRAGPGTTFDIRRLLPFGMPLRVLSRNGDWALVDLNSDGAADGFCFAEYLKAA